MVSKNLQYFVGTSGWSYPHWKGLFYPEALPQSKWFGYYLKKFSTVEVNATFYRTFKDTTYHNWRERAGPDFKYVLKAPKLITHRKHLKDVEEPIKQFWNSAALLKEQLGLILLQLPPNTPFEPDRLKKALLAFPEPKKVAVEFRHNRWLNDKTQGLLQEVGAVFCTADSPKTDLMDWVTSDSAYIRLHGRSRWYSHDYSAHELREVVELTDKMARLGARNFYIFFNNDFDGYAPKNALTLLDMLKS
ncbi:DUF72 domain-containing protein [candidate division KSB1 bacterium]|nr:DUF72 domain-containing protein [candidate division KSB1 bacterium]NIR70057.1 DUF72 domain-containing protein [candidate division KSB1 bacterium]NIS27495.1 DUF72 domain-containing protein [candidate division KSB1 bacterium]NIT74344.1 DUF72 domain-containing protein [candidate division KSB1 bacterium]NIU28213.1 DUF72 domain-containing protein [candidate division KSB1 bacterium]